jgi:hypothetical protein
MSYDIDARIKQLPPLNLGHKGLYIPVYNNLDDVTYYITAEKLLQATNLTYPWQSNVEYDDDQIVSHLDKFWRSLIPNNLNNVPSEGANWTEVSKSASTGFSLWQAGVYDQTEVYVVYDRVIYQLNPIAPRPFNSVDFDTEKTSGSWQSISLQSFTNIVYLDENEVIGNCYNTLEAAQDAVGDGGLIIVNPGTHQADNLAKPGQIVFYNMLPGANFLPTDISNYRLIDDLNTPGTEVHVYGDGVLWQTGSIGSTSFVRMQHDTGYLLIKASSIIFRTSFNLNCGHDIRADFWTSTALSSNIISGSLPNGQEGIISGYIKLQSAPLDSYLFANEGNSTSKRIYKNLRIDEVSGGENVRAMPLVVGGSIIELDNVEINLNDADAKGITVDDPGAVNLTVRGHNYFNRQSELNGSATINYSGAGFLRVVTKIVYPRFFTYSSVPDVNADESLGYFEGAEIYTSGGELWKCVDSSAGAAIWLLIYPQAGGGTLNAIILSQGGNKWLFTIDGSGMISQPGENIGAGDAPLFLLLNDTDGITWRFTIDGSGMLSMPGESLGVGSAPTFILIKSIYTGDTWKIFTDNSGMLSMPGVYLG